MRLLDAVQTVGWVSSVFHQIPTELCEVWRRAFLDRCPVKTNYVRVKCSTCALSFKGVHGVNTLFWSPEKSFIICYHLIEGESVLSIILIMCEYSACLLTYHCRGLIWSIFFWIYLPDPLRVRRLLIAVHTVGWVSSIFR